MQRDANLVDLNRSLKILQKYKLLAKFGFDTAENEPCKVCPLSADRSPRSECELQTAGSLFGLQEYGYVFPKNSKLRDPFSSAIAKTRALRWTVEH